MELKRREEKRREEKRVIVIVIVVVLVVEVEFLSSRLLFRPKLPAKIL